MKEILQRPVDCSARDPYVVKHNGMYYHSFSEDGVSLSVSCAPSIEGLSHAESKKVFIPEEGKEYSKEIWAPELHIIDKECYIYVACDDGNNHNHRMYVLTNHSDDPLMPYTMCGKITDSTDKWAIDGNLMEYEGEYYYLWSGWEGDKNICQNIYIAKMKTPLELSSERVLISTPEFEWEKRGSGGEGELPYINEGPFAFSHQGKHYVTYSASGSWCEDYCIALLELVGSDPLNPDSWKKHETPILSSNDTVKGSGHCSIISEDDTLHVFFHAWHKDEENITWNTVSFWHGIMKLTDNGFVIE